MKKTLPFIVFVFLLLVSYQTMKQPAAVTYIESMKEHAEVASVSKDILYQEIESKSSDYEVKAQNAKIDKVWKKMPGLNGQTVNIDASYEKMKKQGSFDEKLLVFNETKPSIHLHELGAEPIYKGHPDKKMNAFLINVAWGDEHLIKMLKTLEKHQVKVTFFLEGKWVKKSTDLAKKIVADGHEIGNHSYNHPDMRTLTRERALEQITKTNRQIEESLGKKPKWFAPPSGSFKEETVKLAAEEGMETIMWTVDTIDWQKPSPNILQKRVLGKIHNGAMILMHPTDSTAKSLDALITQIKERGYELGTVSDLLSEKRHP
ncbi:polysaccharide deacetylase family protein [Bacillus pumilus]|uniref:polysaccharide deacetylase family protein n=1 Tax=Bacillus pumilus TaxID=1408 RepID=UPI00017A633F|nr:probable sporulation protein, polysaccharide deacetylase family [Bacillus pumilus ATCC 7061]MDR4270243.1 polysaccharide deacetylase family protein [Bacillus pumilus]SNV02561.1 polysaccharide deacetylase [Bacillus pumilus]